MKILVICQYYYPEPFRIKDICENLVMEGHEVKVITGIPNYPEGIVYKGYENGEHRDEVINGVHVHRCFTMPRKKGALHRLLNYYSYSLSSSKYVENCLASDGKPYDLVFVNQLSPVMMANAAITYKRKYNVPILMYCLDLWPDSLLAGGIKKDSLIYKYFHNISRNIYKEMDSILVTSRMFKEYFIKEFGISGDKISYLPQYAEGLFKKLPFKNSDTWDFMFAGNIGEIQSVETIIEAAEILKNKYDNIKWHIVGSGSDLERLKKICVVKELENIIFYGRRPVEEMPELYAKADAMLITLKADPVLSLTLPGKVQSYMAVGKPIIGAIDGETKSVIEDAKCGYCASAEDAMEFAISIEKFIANNDKKRLGDNAHDYYIEHFSKIIFDKNFLDSIRLMLLL